MKAYVVVATKGRSNLAYTLLDYLAKQTYPIERIIIVGSENDDVEGLERHQLVLNHNTILKITNAGSCNQRNVGLNIVSDFANKLNANEWFVTIFDDDYRPANNWIEKCAATFEQDENLAGVGGWVLADGVTKKTLSETEAQSYLNGDVAPVTKSWQGFVDSPYGLYGCNMAFRGNVAKTERFDENLPLYGWQEDLDYGARATKFGQLVKVSDCVGVHLGVSGGRTSGVRFGYSQIANPIYLIKKGTMNEAYAERMMRRNFMSNVFHSITFDRRKDYLGRLYGNLLAIYHIFTSRIHPKNILNI